MLTERERERERVHYYSYWFFHPPDMRWIRPDCDLRFRPVYAWMDGSIWKEREREREMCILINQSLRSSTVTLAFVFHCRFRRLLFGSEKLST